MKTFPLTPPCLSPCINITMLKRLSPSNLILSLILFLSRVYIFLHLIYNHRLPSRWTILCANKHIPSTLYKPYTTEITLRPTYSQVCSHFFSSAVSPGSPWKSSFVLPIHIQKQAQVASSNIHLYPSLEAYSRKGKVGEKAMAQIL